MEFRGPINGSGERMVVQSTRSVDERLHALPITSRPRERVGEGDSMGLDAAFCLSLPT